MSLTDRVYQFVSVKALPRVVNGYRNSRCLELFNTQLPLAPSDFKACSRELSLFDLYDTCRLENRGLTTLSSLSGSGAKTATKLSMCPPIMTSGSDQASATWQPIGDSGSYTTIQTDSLSAILSLLCSAVLRTVNGWIGSMLTLVASSSPGLALLQGASSLMEILTDFVWKVVHTLYMVSELSPLELLGCAASVYLAGLFAATCWNYISPMCRGWSAAVRELLVRALHNFTNSIRQLFVFVWDYHTTNVTDLGALAPVIVQAEEMMESERGLVLRVPVNGKDILVTVPPNSAALLRIQALEKALTSKIQNNVGSRDESMNPINPFMAVKAIPQSVVRIVLNDVVVGCGSRVVATGVDSLLTALHVVLDLKGSRDAKLVNSSGLAVGLDPSWPVVARGTRDGVDFVCISVPLGVWARLGVVRSKVRPIRNGEPIRVFGNDMFGDPAVSQGRVRPGQQLFEVEHDASTKKGWSGTPLFGNDGRIVAIHKGAAPETSTAPNVAVSLDFLSTSLESDPSTSPGNDNPEMWKRVADPDMLERAPKASEARDRSAKRQFLGDFDTKDVVWSKFSQGPRILTAKGETEFSTNGTHYTQRLTLAEALQEPKFKGGAWADMVDDDTPDRDGRDESGLPATLDESPPPTPSEPSGPVEKPATEPPKADVPQGFPAAGGGAPSAGTPSPKASMPTAELTLATTDGSMSKSPSLEESSKPSGKPLQSRSMRRRLRRKSKQSGKQQENSQASTDTSGRPAAETPSTPASKPIVS